MVNKVLREPQVPKVLLGPLDLLGQRALPVRKAPQDLKVR